MPLSETAVWSAMLGGLLTLLAVALGDALASRSMASMRNALFLLIAGGSCVLMTGLPELLFPGLPEQLVRVLQAGLGPLAGAMGLYFLSHWLGGVREDSQVHQLTVIGGAVLMMVGLALAALASQADRVDHRDLLAVAALVNMVPVLLAMLAVRRAHRLGDPLARWMLVGISCLAVGTAGLYARGIDMAGAGLATWMVTAAGVVSSFLIASALGLVRIRQHRELARLSGLDQGAEPATGLPTGAALLTEVEHAFWRTSRRGGVCTVVCLHVSNLYAFTDTAARGTEHQILTTLAARVRRAAGFRCVVGLYHPRCFVVVMSSDKLTDATLEVITRLRSMVPLPLSVMDAQQAYQPFTPEVGVGVVTLEPDSATPMEVINQAERRALGSVGESVGDPSRVSEHDIVTTPASLQ